MNTTIWFRTGQGKRWHRRNPREYGEALCGMPTADNDRLWGIASHEPPEDKRCRDCEKARQGEASET